MKRKSAAERTGAWLCVAAFCGVLAFAVEVTAAERGDSVTKGGDIAAGREIFVREWLPNDPRSHGGDGLGPVFNDTSCVACHNQGEVGGGGPASKNVEILTAANLNGSATFRRSPTPIGVVMESIFGADPTAQPPIGEEQIARQRQREREQMARIHPGFAASRSIVLHYFGTDAPYANWRKQMAGDHQNSFMGGFNRPATVDFVIEVDADGGFGKVRRAQQANLEIQQAVLQVQFNTPQRSPIHRNGFNLTISERNPTALFGAGLIDSIPDEAIEAAAKESFKEWPNVSGRVSRLKDGRIGRFGWKAQTASLYDFTMTACAVELGLHVPDHPQSGLPHKADYEPAGYDLNQKDCDSLVAYLGDLPAPTRREPAHAAEREYLHGGEKLFAGAGCAACHRQDLGEVKNIYSDLLVHDMGAQTADVGEYGVFIPNSASDELEDDPEVLPLTDADGKPTPRGATKQEWRTPPLWGVRDSAPYLHDGRAKTLEQAIALHGGEGTESARRYFMLKTEERLQLEAFLKSLAAPNDKGAVVQVSQR